MKHTSLSEQRGIVLRRPSLRRFLPSSMLLSSRIVFRTALAFMVLCSFTQVSAAREYKPFSPDPIPAELLRFIEPKTRIIFFATADLNGDTRPDHLVVLQKERDESDPYPNDQRPLLLIVRQRDGSLKLQKRSERTVYCSTCGGVGIGDPFQSIEVRVKGFTVNHYGGSALRWLERFAFSYSKKDDTWQLVRVAHESFHSLNPNGSAEKKVYLPPKDFGKIDIADFDPQNFRGQGVK